jgi:ABC-2 type transport system permease protein
MTALAMQLVGILPGLEAVRPYLLTSQFDDWHGLLRSPADWAPITHAAWVSALWAAPAIVTAYLVFLRRDVTGG